MNRTHVPNHRSIDMTDTDTRPANNRAAVRPRCRTCGFRIRGANHEQGAHHQHGKGGKYTPKKG